jgi:hypothetical protein
MDISWTCECCGTQFDTLPMSYGFPAPDNWFALSEAERDTRGELSEDICVIDGTERYVRGCIEIPVAGSEEPLVWGVWASVSEQSLHRIIELREAPVIENEPPRFGWLCNWIKGYPRPVAIKCHLHLRPGRLRPSIELEPTDYPLAVEQRNGITIERVKDFAMSRGHS